MAIECDYKLKCKHQSNNGFHSIIFEQKDEKREKSILMPLIFANYGRRLNIGKVATTIMVVMGIIWIPIMERIGGGVLYQYLQSVQSYIAPPVAAVFLLGITWKRVTPDAAIVTLFSGLVVAALRIISEIFKESLDGFLYLFATINFSHMAIFMFIFSVTICIIASLLTKPQLEEKLKGLTFSTITNEQRASAKNSYTKTDIAFSGILVVIIIFVLTYFTG